MEMINKILWAIASSLIIISSIYFSYKLKFKQLNFFKLFKSLKKSKSINPISNLSLSLAGKIGVGSISGIALAINIGGVGSIFWMWVITIFSAINTYVESFLACKYGVIKSKERNCGPSYYIKYGLKNNKLSIICSIIILISFLIGFIPIQSNTIIKSFNSINLFDNKIYIILLCFISSIIILGGIKKINKATDRIVPFMIILYILLSFIIIIKNYLLIPNILKNIIINAFNFKSFFSSFLPTMIIGIQRGIFASESSIGIGSIATSNIFSNYYEKISYIQVISVYITVFLVCTATALIILTSNYETMNFKNINGIELVQYAFSYHFGKFSNLLILIIIFLFSFSTILTGFYYIDNSVKFFSNKKIILFITKIITIIFIYLGCILSAGIIWKLIDSLIAILAIINIYSIIRLKKEIK